MNPIITKDDLDGIGIEISIDHEKTFVEHVNNMLKERVGLAIAANFSDEQLAKMRELVQADDKVALQTWINEQVSDLDEIIEDEVDILLGDIVKNKENI